MRFYVLAALGIGVLWLADVRLNTPAPAAARGVTMSAATTPGMRTPPPPAAPPSACTFDLVAPPADFYLDEGDTRPDLPGYQRDVVLAVSAGCVGRRIELSASTGESRDYTFDRAGRHTFRDFTFARAWRPGEHIASQLRVDYAAELTPLDLPPVPPAQVQQRRDGRFVGTFADSPGVASYRAHASRTPGGAAVGLCGSRGGVLVADLAPGRDVPLVPCECSRGVCRAVEVP